MISSLDSMKEQLMEEQLGHKLGKTWFLIFVFLKIYFMYMSTL